MPDRLRNLAGPSLVLLAALLGGRPVGAAGYSYGDIEIVPETEPRGAFLHGYAEYRFSVRNRSDDRAVRVTLQIPGEGGRGGGLGSIAKTVEVAPGGLTSVSLLQPAAPEVAGNGVAVYLNGRKQEQTVPMSVVSGVSLPAHMAHRRRGGRSHVAHRGGTRIEANLLTSLRVPEDFFQVPASSRFGIPPRGMGIGAFPGGLGPAGMGGAPPALPGPVPPFDAQIQRADLPVSAWSSRWLAFTRYDGIFVTAEDLDDLQRAGTESRATLQALWQYVETGGVLLVLGNGKAGVEVPIPAAFRPSPLQLDGLLVYHVGFGRCIVSPDRDRKKWTPPPPRGVQGAALAPDRWGVVQQAVSGTSIAFRNSRSFIDLNKNFAVVDDLGLPVKGLFALMVLFGLAMGPANLVWLTRYKRRIWLLWTVPVLSLFFSFAVLGYMVVAEGWQGHARVGGVTILDEGEKRATTLGRAAFYSPVTPGDGLHFRDQTEVQMLGDENAAWTNSCSIDWTNDQHLARGWVTARVPAFFALRKSETLRRERLSLRREADGGLSVANALGVDIAHLWLADEKGRLHRAAAIAAGGSARLEAGGKRAAPAIPLQAWREIYSNTDWLLVAKNLRETPEKFLGPGTYVAVVESSPFLEQGLKNAQVRPSESVILGIMAKEPLTK